jgi:hypothetical protein
MLKGAGNGAFRFSHTVTSWLGWATEWATPSDDRTPRPDETLKRTPRLGAPRRELVDPPAD